MWRTVQFVLLYVFLRSGERCLVELTGSLGRLHGCFPLTLCKLVPLPTALTPRSVLAECKLSECCAFSQSTWDLPKPRRAVRWENSNTGWQRLESGLIQNCFSVVKIRGELRDNNRMPNTLTRVTCKDIWGWGMLLLLLLSRFSCVQLCATP